MKLPSFSRTGALASLHQSCRTGLLLTIVLLITASHAAASDSNVNVYVKEGKTSFAAGHYQSAYDSFFQAFLLVPANPEINFLLGRAAFEKGDYEAAVMAFERVLIADPKALRVKLEMARSFSALKSYEAARQYLLEVLAANPPTRVRENIQAMLDQLEQQQKQHHLHGMLAIGYSYDDNARTDPNNETLNIPGLFPVTFARPSDNISSSTVSLSHTYLDDNLPFFWKSDVVNYIANYQSENDLDITYLRIASGPAWQKDKILFEVRPHFGLVDLGHHAYMKLYGMQGSLTMQQSVASLLQFALSGEGRRNFTDSERDSTNFLLDISYISQFDVNTLRFNTSIERENARNAVHSYYKYLWGLQFFRQLPDAWRASAGLSFSRTPYDDMDPLWGQDRTDDITIASLGIGRSLWISANRQQTITADLNFSHTEANSTLDLYTYDKNVINLTVAYAF